MPIRRFLAPAVALVATASLLLSACGDRSATGFARQYEYQEDVYVNVDGSATIIVNASLPSLVALKGLDLPVEARTRVDRDAVREAFESATSHVTRVSRPWRRRGRRFIQVRVEVSSLADVARSPAFPEAHYELSAAGGRTTFRGTIDGEARKPVPEAGWDGSELVAFKVHLPSRVHFHNVRDLDTNQPGEVERGNILRWEQRLRDRLAGVPIEMRVEMDEASILYRTLWLFAGAFGGAMLLLVSLIWWTVRRGKSRSMMDAGRVEHRT